jgi:methylated-DNA-[protein]-cysteine S-methyltransferase
MSRTNHQHHIEIIKQFQPYFSIFCKYKFLEFQMIISKVGIEHLSFSPESHQKALKKIGAITPENAQAELTTQADHIKKLVQQVLGPEQKKTEPDFTHNPFLKNGTPFQQKIWREIVKIKPGSTITYGTLATAAGIPGGARAAGHACNQNPLALIIPCHRVVAANGPGGFAGDLEIKLKLLEIEKKTGIMPDVLLDDILLQY